MYFPFWGPGPISGEVLNFRRVLWVSQLFCISKQALQPLAAGRIQRDETHPVKLPLRCEVLGIQRGQASCFVTDRWNIIGLKTPKSCDSFRLLWVAPFVCLFVCLFVVVVVVLLLLLLLPIITIFFSDLTDAFLDAFLNMIRGFCVQEFWRSNFQGPKWPWPFRR